MQAKEQIKHFLISDNSFFFSAFKAYKYTKLYKFTTNWQITYIGLLYREYLIQDLRIFF